MQRITLFASVKESKDIDNRSDFSVQEIGILTPATLRTTALCTGQVRFFALEISEILKF